MPALETAYGVAREAMTAARAEAALSEQAIDAAGAEQRNLDRQLAALQQRRERLAEEQTSIGSPDEEKLATLGEDVARLEARLAQQTAAQAESDQQVAAATAQRQRHFDERAAAQDTLTRIEARLAALRQVQASVEADTRLDPWLAAQGLDRLPRLFRKLSVEPGFETAFEAAARARRRRRSGATGYRAALTASAPPARVAFFSTTGAVARDGGQCRALTACRTESGDTMQRLPRCWRTGSPTSSSRRIWRGDGVARSVATGGQFVVREGHLVSRYGVRFFAADDEKSGLLARRLEIDNLDREIRAQRLIVAERTAAVARSESLLRESRERLAQQRRDGELARSESHAAQLEAVRLGELIERVRHRSGQIGAELQEIETHERELRAHRDEADSRFQLLDGELAARHEAVETARLQYEQADQSLRSGRDEQRTLESARQQVEFALASNQERERDVMHAAEVAAADAAHSKPMSALPPASLRGSTTGPRALASRTGCASAPVRRMHCARRAAGSTSSPSSCGRPTKSG